ncbi:Panacea domain-containing protein [Weissella viridescens]|uniref:Panacea domain-containing protein n=1 Tax=Weissella viridescens TaxID=1629 RepID=UPI003AF2FF51
MPMVDLARHIIAVANENNRSVTNLQLQKVMYFTLQAALREQMFTDEQLHDIYDEPFLVWRYGPVVEDVYARYSIFGASSIIEEDQQLEVFNGLNANILELLREPAFNLVQRSHNEDFWKNHENDINGWRSAVQYELRDIIANGN